MSRRFPALSLLATLALILAPAGSAVEKDAVSKDSASVVARGSGDGLFGFQCAIDCGNGQWYWVEAESLQECVEACENLCHNECSIAH